MVGKRLGCSIAVVVVMGALVGVGAYLAHRLGVGGDGVPLTLTTVQVQTGLQQAFPVDKSELGLNIHLAHPTAELDSADGDRIGFGADVGISAYGRKLANGTVVATGKLRYDVATGTFYLDDPKIKRLDIDRVNGFLSGNVRKAVSYVLDKGIRHLPVYQLDQTDPVQRYAKRGIRSVRVTDGQVEIRFGLNP